MGTARILLARPRGDPAACHARPVYQVLDWADGLGEGLRTAIVAAGLEPASTLTRRVSSQDKGEVSR